MGTILSCQGWLQTHRSGYVLAVAKTTMPPAPGRRGPRARLLPAAASAPLADSPWPVSRGEELGAGRPVDAEVQRIGQAVVGVPVEVHGAGQRAGQALCRSSRRTARRAGLPVARSLAASCAAVPSATARAVFSVPARRPCSWPPP